MFIKGMKLKMKCSRKMTSILLLTILMLLQAFISYGAAPTSVSAFAGGTSGFPTFYDQQMAASNIGTATVGSDGSLRYSMQMGDVALVYNGKDGWSLAGGSSIYRSTRRWLPHYYDDSDILELDGQELVYISGSNPREYRTKKESYQKILYYNSTTPATSYWTVNRPDGSMAYYGNTSDSRSIATTGNYINKVRAWDVNQIQDRGGYTISNFKYIPFSSGQNYLTTVITGKTGCGTNGYKTTAIQYSISQYQTFSYRAGYKVTTNSLIPTKVFVRIGTDNAGNGSNLVNTYTIEYTSVNTQTDIATGKQLVYKIYKSGTSDSPQLPPVTFTYQRSLPVTSFITPITVPGSETWGKYLRDQQSDLRDVDGDGIPDRCFSITSGNDLNYYKGKGDGTFDTTLHSYYTNGGNFSDNENDYIDINGDGKLDRVVKPKNQNMWVYLNNGSGFNAAQLWLNVIPLFEDLTLPRIQDFDTEMWNGIPIAVAYYGLSGSIMDMNGDGIPDRVTKYGSSGYTPFAVYKGFGHVEVITIPAMPPATPITISMCFNLESDWNKPSGSRTDNYPLKHLDEATLSTDPWSGVDCIDMNGDGLPDRVMKIPGQDGNKLKVWYNNGYGFEDYVLYNTVTDNYALRYKTTDHYVIADYMDMNSDGLPDRVIYDPTTNNIKVFLNTGNDFMSTSVFYGNILSNDINGSKFRYGKDLLYNDLIDINGDGYPDYVYKNTGNTLKMNLRTVPAPIGALLKITNSLGGSTEYTYKPLNKVDNPDCVPNMWVVDQVKVSDGFPSGCGDPTNFTNPLITTYVFKNGLYDMRRKEFRGFGYVKTIAPTGDYTETNYFIDWYQAGKIKNTSIYNAAGSLFSYTEIVDATGNPAYTAYSTCSSPVVKLMLPEVTRGYVTDGAPISAAKYTKSTNSYTFDANLFLSQTTTTNYGEVDSSYNDTGYDIAQEITTYTNDPANWLIGLVNEKEIWGYEGSTATLVKQSARKNNYYTQVQQAGQLLKEVQAWDGTNWVNPTAYTYNTYGNVLTVTDPDSNITTTTYDTTYRNYPVTVTNALGHVVENIYDTFMRIITVRHHDVKGTEDIDYNTRYDTFGRVVKKWGPYGLDSDGYRNEQIKYQDAIFSNGTISQPANIMVQRGQIYGWSWGYYDLWTRTSIDGLGRTIQVKSNGHNNSLYKVVRTFYYIDGNKTVIRTHVPFASDKSGPDLVVPSAGISSVPYTATVSYLDTTEGKVTLAYNPDGANVKTTDKLWYTKVTNEKNKITHAYRDGLGRMTLARDASGVETEYSFKSGTGALLSITAASNAGGYTNTTTFAYNMLGQKTNVSDPDLGHMLYTYKPGGNLWTIHDDNTNDTTCTYDALGRLTNTRTVDSGGTIYNLYNDYDIIQGWESGYSKGKLVSTTAKIGGTPISTKYFKFDKEGRLLKEYHSITGAGSAEMNYTYNAIGQVVNLTYPSVNGTSEVVTYEYDNMSGLETRVREQNWNPQYVSSINYLPYRKIKDMTYGNGVVTSYQYYDNAEDGTPDPVTDYRLKKITFNKSGGLSHYQKYTYDRVGNITDIKDANTTYNQAFSYDDVNRMTYASGYYSGVVSGDTDYQYDALGNMILKAGTVFRYYDPNHIHAITADGVSGSYNWYYYDNNGNMISKNNLDLSKKRVYTYDGNNMLTTVKDGNNVLIMSAKYHGTDRVSCNDNDLGFTTYYFFPQYEQKVSNATGIVEHVKYYYSNGNRIAQRRVSTSYNYLSYYHQDLLGSTIKMSSDNGVELGGMRYLPYGENYYSGGLANYMYNDKQQSDSGDLYYYQARYYNPRIGRFTTADTRTPGAGTLQGLNRYSYCMNNPIRYIDPTGHGDEETIGDFEDLLNVLSEDQLISLYYVYKAQSSDTSISGSGSWGGSGTLDINAIATNKVIGSLALSYHGTNLNLTPISSNTFSADYSNSLLLKGWQNIQISANGGVEYDHSTTNVPGGSSESSDILRTTLGARVGLTSLELSGGLGAGAKMDYLASTSNQTDPTKAQSGMTGLGYYVDANGEVTYGAFNNVKFSIYYAGGSSYETTPSALYLQPYSSKTTNYTNTKYSASANVGNWTIAASYGYYTSQNVITTYSPTITNSGEVSFTFHNGRDSYTAAGSFVSVTGSADDRNIGKISIGYGRDF